MGPGSSNKRHIREFVLMGHRVSISVRKLKYRSKRALLYRNSCSSNFATKVYSYHQNTSDKGMASPVLRPASFGPVSGLIVRGRKYIVYICKFICFITNTYVYYRFMRAPVRLSRLSGMGTSLGICKSESSV